MCRRAAVASGRTFKWPPCWRDRLVWCVGRLAFKIAKSRLGARCNRYEATYYYREASPE
jgi:hypothetical protein